MCTIYLSSSAQSAVSDAAECAESSGGCRFLHRPLDMPETGANVKTERPTPVIELMNAFQFQIQ